LEPALLVRAFTQAPRPAIPGEIRAEAGRIPARREAWPCACSLRREVKEFFIVNVSLRYILAAIAFGIAALGLFLL
jgi:hypothetical protein